MERDYFIYKTHVSFSIVSEQVEPEKIASELRIDPDRSFRKGETSISKHSGSVITKPHNLWQIKSKDTESRDESITHHFEYLKNILLPQMDILKRYKEDSRFELTYWIWIETDNSGIGFNISSDDLTFINQIANHVYFSVITNQKYSDSSNL
jgi:hypothetical protein